VSALLLSDDPSDAEPLLLLEDFPAASPCMLKSGGCTGGSVVGALKNAPMTDWERGRACWEVLTCWVTDEEAPERDCDSSEEESV
jgi:hypothetical protein